MAQIFKSASGEIQQMVMIPAEEAAAHGVNVVQQQLASSHQIMQLAPCQPLVNQSSVHQLAETFEPQRATIVSGDADSNMRVQVSHPVQWKAQPQTLAVINQQVHQLHSVQQVLTAVQQTQLKAVPQPEQIHKFHIIQAVQPQLKTVQLSLNNQTMQQSVSPVITQAMTRQLVIPQQIDPKSVQQCIKLKPAVQAKRPLTVQVQQQGAQQQFHLTSEQQFQPQTITQQLQLPTSHQHHLQQTHLKLKQQAVPKKYQKQAVIMQKVSPQTSQQKLQEQQIVVKQEIPQQASHQKVQQKGVVIQQVPQQASQLKLQKQQGFVIQQVPQQQLEQQQGVITHQVLQEQGVVVQPVPLQVPQQKLQSGAVPQVPLQVHHQRLQQQTVVLQPMSQHDSQQNLQQAIVPQQVPQQTPLSNPQQPAAQSHLVVPKLHTIHQQSHQAIHQVPSVKLHQQTAQQPIISQQLQVLHQPLTTQQIVQQQPEGTSQVGHQELLQQFPQEISQPHQHGSPQPQSQSKVTQSHQMSQQSILKLPSSSLQHLQHHLATQGKQMILVQSSQPQHSVSKSSPQPGNSVQTQPALMQQVTDTVKTHHRSVRPVLFQKNPRTVTPVVIRKPTQNQQDSSQTVMMMYPHRPQAAVQHGTPLPGQQGFQKDVDQINGTSLSSEVCGSNSVIPNISQGQQVTPNTQCYLSKSSQTKNCVKKLTVQHVAVTQHATYTATAQQGEQQAQPEVPNPGVQLSTASNKLLSVSSRTTQTQTRGIPIRSLSVTEAQCQTVLTNNEVQASSLNQIIQPSNQEHPQQVRGSDVQVALTQQQFQKLLQQRQLQTNQQNAQLLQHVAHPGKNESSSPSRDTSTQGSAEVQKCSSVQLINCRSTGDTTAVQNTLKSKSLNPIPCQKQESNSSDLKCQQVMHLQANKVNYILDADFFFKQLQRMADGNVRIILHPDGVASLQQMEPVAVEPAHQESHVAVFDGMEVKDEFPTGVPQECVVSESGEVILANSNLVKTESESTENLKNSCSSTMEFPEEESAEEQLKLTALDVPSMPGEEVDTSTPTQVFSNANNAPKFQKGMLAVCSHCGILSRNFNRCDRCQHKISENVKSLPDTCSQITGYSRKIPNTTTTMPPMTPVTPLLVKRTLNLPAEKIPPKYASNHETTLHGTVVISPDLKRRNRHSHKKTKARVADEPEILTLSSDDEDKKAGKSVSESSSVIKNLKPILDAEAKAIASSEEPDSSEEMGLRPVGAEGGGMMEQAVDGSICHPHVMIQCRTVRIGTFKEKPSDRVTISPLGVEIKLSTKQASLPDLRVSLKMSDIKKVLTSFSRTMPVIFIYMREEGAAKIRELLNMTDPKGSCYFDPNSFEETHKRITLLPEKLPEEAKVGLQHIFKNNMTEINYKLANEILVKSSPRENLRSKQPAPSEEIKTIMVYPPPPAKGGISINTEDYACLGEDQFLNDVIIDFYLKYLMQSVLSEEDRERTHVFSSFFYKRLTSRPKSKGRRHPIEDDPKLSSAQKRHARVKSWTKNVNLFSKDFIIIPINENCHWFLAIVCFPGQDGCRRMKDNTLIEAHVPTTSPAVVAAAAAAVATTNSKLKVQNNVMSIGSTTITPVKPSTPATITLDHNGDEGSDRDEAEGDEEEMEEPPSDEEHQEPIISNPEISKTEDSSDESHATTSSSSSCVKLKKPKEREKIKQPCILIFDSLVGAPRYRVVATLRDYLSIEYKAKEGKDKEFSKFTIKGMLPKVPQQNNFTDCGLYLLQYVESFFKNPIKDYHHPIKELQDWFPEEIVTRKREEIVLLLHELMSQQKIDPKSLPLPVLTFSHNTASVQQEQAEDSDTLRQEHEAKSTALLVKQQAEDTEAAATLVAAMEEHETQPESMQSQPAITEESSELEEPLDSSIVPDGDNHPGSQSCQAPSVDAESMSKSASESCGSLENSEEPASEQSLCSKSMLVDYSESSNDSSSDQLAVKRGTEQEDLLVRKKRKCMSD